MVHFRRWCLEIDTQWQFAKNNNNTIIHPTVYSIFNTEGLYENTCMQNSAFKIPKVASYENAENARVYRIGGWSTDLNVFIASILQHYKVLQVTAYHCHLHGSIPKLATPSKCFQRVTSWYNTSTTLSTSVIAAVRLSIDNAMSTLSVAVWKQINQLAIFTKDSWNPCSYDSKALFRAKNVLGERSYLVRFL